MADCTPLNHRPIAEPRLDAIMRKLYCARVKNCRLSKIIRDVALVDKGRLLNDIRITITKNFGATNCGPLRKHHRAPSLGVLAQPSGAAIAVGIGVLLGARTASDRNFGVRKKQIGVAPNGSGAQAS